VQYKDRKRMPAPSEKLGRGLLVLSGFLRICSAWLWLGRGMSRPDARKTCMVHFRVITDAP
jgi:hypothetical protein